MEYSVAGAAKALNLSERGVRSAMATRRLRTLGTDATQVRISEQEVERYRHRKKDAVTVSWDIVELPRTEVDALPTSRNSAETSDNPPAPVRETTTEEPASTRDPLRGHQLVTVPYNATTDTHEILVRVYDQPEPSPAEAVIVVGDLLRYSAGIAPQELPLLAEKILAQVSHLLPSGTTVTDVCWILPTGAASELEDTDTRTIFATTLRHDRNAQRIEEFTAHLVSVAAVEAVIGTRLITWPAFEPDQPRQHQQWIQVMTSPHPLRTWVVDQGHAEDHLLVLGRLVRAVATPLQQQFAAHLAEEVDAVIGMRDRARPTQLPDWIALRVDVQILDWSPSEADRQLVAQWVNHCDPATLQEAYADALEWYYSVDEYSPTPDRALADTLYSALSRVQFFNQKVADLPLPASYRVDPVSLAGDLGAEWRSTLHPAGAMPTDNSPASRQRRALRAEVYRHYENSRYRIGPEMVDDCGVYCYLMVDGYNAPHSDDMADSALVVRPTTTDHLSISDLQGARVQGHQPRDTIGDLAMYLRLPGGVLTLLPHRAEHTGVAMGYKGSGPRNLAEDIAAVKHAVHGQPADLEEIYQHVSESRRTHLDMEV